MASQVQCPPSCAPEAGAPQSARLPSRIRRSIYWIDLLASVGIGGGSFAIAATLPLTSWTGSALTIVAILAWLRAIVFVHEIAHRAREIPGFEVAWNLLVGIPMGVPSLLYVGSHASHHHIDRYGTGVDPEYASLAAWGIHRKLMFVAGSSLASALLVLRWGVLGPLSLANPRLRSLVVGRLSTLSINTGYIRPMPQAGERLRWVAGEIAATTFVWSAALAVVFELLPAALVVRWLLVISGVFVVNQARTVLAHRYAGDGEPVGQRGQLLDSLTLPEHSWLAALIAPVGLRYHALHHWRPGIPYHDLGRVHRRLLAESRRSDPYLETLVPSLATAVRAHLTPSRLRASRLAAHDT